MERRHEVELAKSRRSMTAQVDVVLSSFAPVDRAGTAFSGWLTPSVPLVAMVLTVVGGLWFLPAGQSASASQPQESPMTKAIFEEASALKRSDRNPAAAGDEDGSALETWHRVAATQDVPEILERLQSNRGRRSQSELNSIRERRVGRYERENPTVLKELAPVVQSAQASTFEVINPNYWVSMGAVVTADGYAITKASELEQDKPIQARFSQKKVVTASIVRIDEANDIALLKLEDGAYTPVQWSGVEPQPGDTLLSVGVREDVMTLGFCSCEARSLIERGRGLMGVRPRETSEGIAVYGVENAARRAGLRDGDIIVSIQGREIKRVPEFVSLIRKYRAGDEVIIKTKRGNEMIDLTVRLSGQRSFDRAAPRFEAMNLLGSINSQRSSSFPWAMQHDSPLMPEQCGGPLVNLRGEVVGLNIARAGRTASYALTGEHLVETLAGLEIPGWSK